MMFHQRLGAVHKRRPQSGGESFNQNRHFADKRGGKVFQMQTSTPHFLVQKTSDFLTFMACSHGQGKGGGQFFFADVFYGNPLFL